MSEMTRDMWHTCRTTSKKDKTHPAKTLGRKKNQKHLHSRKKDKKFKKKRRKKLEGFLVMHIGLASKKIPSSSAPSLSPKSSFCFFVRGPRIKNGEDGGNREYKNNTSLKKASQRYNELALISWIQSQRKKKVCIDDLSNQMFKHFCRKVKQSIKSIMLKSKLLVLRIQCKKKFQKHFSL